MEKNSYQVEINRLIEVGNYVYKQLGHGCQEHVYKKVMELELELRNIPFSKRVNKGSDFNDDKETYLCFDKVIVGLETHSFLSEEQENKFMNSLKDVVTPIGLLFNFGYENLQYIKIGGKCVLQ